MKRKYRSKLLIVSFLIMSLLLNACRSNEEVGTIEDGYIDIGDITLEQVQLPQVGEEILVVTTNKGTFKMRLFEDIAPKTVTFIKELVEQGFYDGLHFFNNIEYTGFQVELTEEKIESVELMGTEYIEEKHEDYRNFNGAVGLGRHNGVGAFYIVSNSGIEEEYLDAMGQLSDLYPEHIVDAYSKLGGLPDFDDEFTVFGQVFSGIDVVSEINTIPRDDTTGKLDEDVIIESIEIDTFEGK